MDDGIGMRLKELRLERHYTQREVAERMHMLQSAYSQLLELLQERKTWLSKPKSWKIL